MQIIKAWGRVVAMTLCLSTVVAHAQDVETIRDVRLQTLLEVNRSGTTDPAITESVMSLKWPAELLPTVNGALDAALALQPADTELNPTVIRAFVDLHGLYPPALVDYLAVAIPKAGHQDAIDLLKAARSMGRSAQRLEPVLRDKLRDREELVAMVAASALARVVPDDQAAQRSLAKYLESDRPELLWRALDAVGRSSVDTDATKNRLRKLMQHDDVRVRVTAATALWRLAPDDQTALPVLIDSLQKDDHPMPLGYWFPSRSPPTHHIYVASVLGEMRGAGNQATLKPLVELIDRVSRHPKTNGESEWTVGYCAIRAIVHSGPVPQGIKDDIRRYTLRKLSALDQMHETLRLAVDSLEVTNEEGPSPKSP